MKLTLIERSLANEGAVRQASQWLAFAVEDNGAAGIGRIRLAHLEDGSSLSLTECYLRTI
jgi:hypothetical protein